MSTTTPTGTATAPLSDRPELSLLQLNAMRGGYALMAIGLALVKWPLLPEAHTMPVYEGVTLMMLTAMSLLALLGLRYPVQMLPVLVFETLWKLMWLAAVALPQALTGDLNDLMSEMVFRNSLVVLIIVAIPWKYAWTHYVRQHGDRWWR